MLRQDSAGTRPLYRKSSEVKEARRRKKEMAKTNWFKEGKGEKTDNEKMKQERKQQQKVKGGGKKAKQVCKAGGKASDVRVMSERKDGKGENGNHQGETEGVLFVPQTPDNELCRRIQEVDDRMAALHGGRKLKVVERSGTQLINLMGKG